MKSPFITLFAFIVTIAAFAQTDRDRLMQTVDTLTAAKLSTVKQFATQGDPESQTILALVYQRGKLVNENHVEACRLLRLAAAKDYAPAQNALGVSYQMGWGVDRDIDQAASLYRAAAKNGYAAAQFNLGNLYYESLIKGESDEALAWWSIAADAGDTSARAALQRLDDEAIARASFLAGKKFLDGSDVAKDPDRALKYLTAASKLGSVDADLTLGSIYLRIPEKRNEGLRLLQKWADQHNVAASLQLATYAKEHGEFSKALKWYEEALTPKTSSAFAGLGAMYLEGRGIATDRVTGVMYLIIGNSLHDDECRRQLETMKRDADTVKKAKEKATKWLKEDRHRDVWLALYQPRPR